MDRRLFLKTSLAASQVAALATAGLLTPTRVLADWSSAGFSAEKLDVAMQELLGTTSTEPSDQIEILTKDFAENGATVPVTLKSNIPDTEVIYLFAEKNPAPALAEYMLTPLVDAEVACRVKLGASGDLVAVAKAGGKLYSNRKFVKVVAGGCA